MHLRMCNMMHYDRLLLPLFPFVFIQVSASVSRYWRARSAGLHCRDMASPKSLPGNTCMPKTCVAISLVYLFALLLNHRVHGTILLWMNVAIHSLGLAFIAIEDMTKTLIDWIYYNSIHATCIGG